MKMMTMTMILALAAILVPSRAHAGVEPEPQSGPRGSGDLAAPPLAWQAADPADSVYRAAREALTRNEFRRAADLFGRIHEGFPRSAYAPDALYWNAFALYRLGGSNNLGAAVRLLRLQGERHPRAATRRDADALAVRIQGELARLGDAESAERITTRAQETSCPEENDQSDIRIAALNALVHVDADRALPILKGVLARKDECAVPLRRKAVFLVSQMESPETEGILLELARTDPDREVRRQAVFWLSEVETESAVDALEQVLRSSDDEELRKKAIFALSEHESPRSAQILRAFAEQTANPEELRGDAIFWIGQQESSENAEFLRALFGRLASSALKEKVLFSLAEMEGFGNDRWLLDVALNSSETLQIRKKALFWAGEADAPIAEMVALYDRIPDQEMKEQLIFVYSHRDESAAVDKLIEIARRESNLELRKKAIFWLSESDDPRAVQVLQELINQP